MLLCGVDCCALSRVFIGVCWCLSYLVLFLFGGCWLAVVVVRLLLLLGGCCCLAAVLWLGYFGRSCLVAVV